MKKNLTLTFITIGIVLIVSDLVKFDLWIQDLFFINGKWIISKDNPYMRYFLYKLPKLVLGIIGFTGLILFILSFYKQRFYKYRNKSLLIFLSILFVPLIVSSLKSLTNLYCPNQLSLYNGDKPYIRLLSKYPKDFHPPKAGKCYPAGHASGGFALLSLYYILKRKNLAIITGLAYGWLMGLYQMLSGSHFFSDTVISMLIAWATVSIIALKLK